MSFLRNYESEMRKYTDAPDVFHRAMATSLLGAALTTYDNRCILYGGSSRLWTNVWTLIVGDSGRSRKTTCVHMMAEVLSRMENGEALRAPDDGSPEGYAKDFVKRDRLQKGNAAALMVQGEMYSFLSSLLKDYMKSMKAMLMDFYDAPALYKRTLSKEEFQVRRPRFSMVGGLASELLPSMTSADDWLGGWMSRCILIHGVKNRELDRPGTPDPTTYAKLAREVDVTLGRWRRTRKAEQKKVKATKGKSAIFLFDYDDPGVKQAKKVLKSYPPPADPNVNLLLGRAPQHLMKLSAIEQVAMDPDATCITAAAVDAASVLFDHYMKSAPQLMQGSFARSNADLEGDRLQRRLLRLLRDAGDTGIAEFDLIEASVLDWERYQKAFQTLEAVGLAVREADPESGTVTIRLGTRAK